MRLILIAVGCLASLASAVDQAYVSLNAVPPRFVVQSGQAPDDAIAWATFDNQITDKGFSFLEVNTNPLYPDNYQAYAAGIVEGFLTRSLISMHYNNTQRDYCQGQEAYCAKLNDFLQKNLDYVNDKIQKNRETDSYWFQTELALNQLQGIQDAWDGTWNEQYLPQGGFDTVAPILFLNADGDFEDLEQALNAPKKNRVVGDGHCSALIKLLPLNSDILTSHVTWSGYSTMLRILKKYSLNYKTTWLGDKHIAATNVSFSSSPGRIFSGDDFHIMSSGLVSLETTIGNSNASLWSHIKPTCNLEWARTIVANRLATNAIEWAEIFQKEKSGTYNNQWMIVDYNKFTVTNPPAAGTLVVLEEIPGMIKYADQTERLISQSYWASYNIPFYQEIYNISGWTDEVKQNGDWFTYTGNPRGLIFARDHTKAINIDAMMKVMRYNDYQHDEFSRCDCNPPYSAENAISARSDLNPANGTYPFGALGHRSHGATDAKVTSSYLVKQLQFLAVAGPTYDPLPPFQWSKSGLNDLHEGHPDLWQFEPLTHIWN